MNDAAKPRSTQMRKVILESPYAESPNSGTGSVRGNIRYARAALKHSLSLGEAPIASHLLYTQRGVLNDADPKQREHGIAAGLAWADACDAAVFYADHGLSHGMLSAMDLYIAAQIPVEIRYLNQRRGGKSAQREGLGEPGTVSAVDVGSRFLDNLLSNPPA